MLETLRNIVQEVNAAEGLNDALQIIVRRIQDAMNTEVCSVYLRDHSSGRYVFRATQGLNQDQVGVASLGPGDGLVGLVAEREEPVNLQEAEKHPHFQFMPDIGEEPFHAFLGVPIIHQKDVLGVLVVQQAERRRFDESDEAFLVTLSAQLAGVIAHAQVTGSVETQANRGAAPARIAGVPGAPGVAIGTVVVMTPGADLYAVPSRPAQDRRAEVRAFRDALRQVRKDIQVVAENLDSRLSAEDHALFDVYVSILDDSTLGSEVVRRIKEGEWAQGAL
ncbi:MAG: GAF domain-containing protein, partial [Pseudomonadota bacterium]